MSVVVMERSAAVPSMSRIKETITPLSGSPFALVMFPERLAEGLELIWARVFCMWDKASTAPLTVRGFPSANGVAVTVVKITELVVSNSEVATSNWTWVPESTRAAFISEETEIPLEGSPSASKVCRKRAMLMTA